MPPPISDKMDNTLRIISYNCKDLTVSEVPCIKQLLLQSDVLLLEETWLFTNEFHVISKYFNSYESISISTLKPYNIMMKMENNHDIIPELYKVHDSVDGHRNSKQY